MRLEVTRRDVMKFTAGGALGIALSPAPWRLLDDLAIWTQNGSWIPRVPRGPVTRRATVCNLCPAGCPVSARCVGDIPVQLSSASGTPLCTLGLTGHHLSYHPRRLTAAARVTRAEGRISSEGVPVALALAEVSRAVTAAGERGGAVAVLDLRPDRSVSWAWRRLLASLPGGTLIPSPARESAGMSALQDAMSGAESPGLDLASARTILSFGAPLASGWGAPENLQLILDGRRRLIQVEPVRSATASLASTWLPVKPGTEALVALAIARELSGMVQLDHEVVRSVEGLEDVLGVVARVEPDKLATATGSSVASLRQIAGALLAGSPSVVIAGEGAAGIRAEAAIGALNALLDVIGAGGCLTTRAALPAPMETGDLAPVRELHAVPDGSITMLIIDASAGDGAVPWPAVARTLRDGATVVALSPFLSGTALHAGLVLPTLPFLEVIGEIPTPFDAPVASYALSASLLPVRSEAVDPVSLIRRLADVTGAGVPFEQESTLELMRERATRIHDLGRGAVTRPDGETVGVSDMTSAKLWDELLAGGRWSDARGGDPVRWNLSGGLAAVASVANASRKPRARSRTRPLRLLVRGHRDITASAVASPVMTKLYQESGLRREAGVAEVHPRTAREAGLRDGRSATLETAAGSLRVTVTVDRAIPPGTIVSALAPTAGSLGISPLMERTLLDICEADEDGAWGTCDARLVEV